MDYVQHCYRCGLNLPAYKFYKGKTKEEGFSSFCRKCRKIMDDEELDLRFKSGLQFKGKL
jgi:hypothetical protein